MTEDRKSTPFAKRPVIEMLEQRSLYSATVLAAAPAALVKGIDVSAPAMPARVEGAGLVEAPVGTGAVENAAIFSSARVRAFDGATSPTWANVPAAASASASAFVSQVFALLARVSGAPSPAGTATPAAVPIVTTPPAMTSDVSAMAVAASSVTRAIDTQDAVATPATSAESIQVQATTTDAAQATPAPAYAVVLPANPQLASTAPEPQHATVKALLSEAAAIVHTATGFFTPDAQMVAAPVRYVDAAMEMAPVAYNFLRFDPGTLLGGAVADFTREMTGFAPTVELHPGADHRWAWFVTGAVVTADVVLVAHYQIRRARALRGKRAAVSSVFSDEFVGDYVRD